MSSYRSQPGWVAQLITRSESVVAKIGKFLDNGGRLRGTPDNTVGVFPSDASSVTFTPANNANWTGGVDPGGVKEALDQIAARLQAGGH